MSEDRKVILKVTNLKTHFDVTKGLFSKKQIVKAVDVVVDVIGLVVEVTFEVVVGVVCLVVEVTMKI